MGQDSARLYYVLTIKGDVGPLSISELREQTRSGILQRDSHVRTAFGRQLGTIDDLLRSTSSDRIPRRTTSDRQRAPAQRRPVYLLVPAAVIVIGGAVLFWPSREAVPAAPAQQPVEVSLPLPPPPSPTTPPLKPAPVLRTTPTVTPASVRPAAITDGKELLAGINFNKPSADVLTAWICNPAERKRVSCRSEAGLSVLRLQATNGDALLRQNLTLPPDTRTLQLSYQVRVAGVQPGKQSWNLPRIVLQWGSDPKGNHQIKVHFPTAAGWEAQQKTIPVPAGETACSLWVGLSQCSGTMDLCQLSLRVLEEPPVPATTDGR